MHTVFCVCLSDLLEVKVIFLNGLEAIESQIIVGLGECSLTLERRAQTLPCFTADNGLITITGKCTTLLLLSCHLVVCFVSSFLFLVIWLPCET